MIEVALAKSGVAVLKKNGRLLGSIIDPVREAHAWADQVCASAGARDFIVVLGLASGHHIAELVQRRPKDQIIVVECDVAVRNEALFICPEIADVKIIVEPDWTKLIDNADFKDAVGGIYHIAVHGPSSQIESEYFKSVQKLLRGRDKLTFLMLLKSRPDLFAALDAEKISEIADEAVSIKTIQKLFVPAALASRERRLWRVLEELVQ